MRPQYNKLLGRQWRCGVIVNNAPGYVIDEDRCSGRTLSKILGAISTALSRPCEWISVSDHYDEPGKDIPQFRQDRLCNEIMSYAAKLDLKFFEKRTGRFGAGGRMVSQIRCNSFTDNPWEIV